MPPTANMAGIEWSSLLLLEMSLSPEPAAVSTTSEDKVRNPHLQNSSTRLEGALGHPGIIHESPVHGHEWDWA